MPSTQKSFGFKFLELLEDSIIVQSLVTLGVVSATVYLSITGQDVSKTLQAVTYTIVGFWFGTKVQHEGQKQLRNQKEMLQNM